MYVPIYLICIMHFEDGAEIETQNNSDFTLGTT